MIIVKLNGGLGNQLFQYATGRQLALKNNTKLKLDITWYDTQKKDYRRYVLGNFTIKADLATKEDISFFNKTSFKKIIEKIKPFLKKTIIKEKAGIFEKRILRLTGNLYLVGYWQNEQYFKGIADIIKQEISLSYDPGEKFNDIVNTMSSCNSVSIHIRRGDYLNEKFSKIFLVLSLEYYYRAISLILKKISNPHFFVFADDVEWAKKNLNLKYSTTFISGLHFKDHEELILMSKCKHNIIANSSFSWWGAWLNSNNDKIIISPNKWHKDNTISDDLMPASWIKL